MCEYLHSNDPEWEEFAKRSRAEAKKIDWNDYEVEEFSSPADRPKSWFQHFKGLTHTVAVRKKISKAMKVSMIGKKNALGHKKTEEAKQASKRFGSDNGRARPVTIDGVTYPTKRAAIEAGVTTEWKARSL